MYIKKFFENTIMRDAGSGISLAYFPLGDRPSDVRNYYGIRGLQSGTGNAEIPFVGLWRIFSICCRSADVKTGDCNMQRSSLVAKINGNIIMPLTFAIRAK